MWEARWEGALPLLPCESPDPRAKAQLQTISRTDGPFCCMLGPSALSSGLKQPRPVPEAPSSFSRGSPEVGSEAQPAMTGSPQLQGRHRASQNNTPHHPHEALERPPGGELGTPLGSAPWTPPQGSQGATASGQWGQGPLWCDLPPQCHGSSPGRKDGRPPPRSLPDSTTLPCLPLHEVPLSHPLSRHSGA